MHQAHGALQMVDVDGVGVMTQAAEAALDRFHDGLLDCTTEHAQQVSAVYTAVIEYLEELLSGAPAAAYPPVPVLPRPAGNAGRGADSSGRPVLPRPVAGRRAAAARGRAGRP
ncbi:hypothetical protein LP420_26070 [Massilia sp. B-10]|nr:hypothetical protein LP420_26070 [Massilia sp. B-10]